MFAKLGSADVLLAHGFEKEASALYTEAFLKSAMSPEEIVALIQRLPPGVQEEILKQLQQHATVADAVSPEGAKEGEAKTASESGGVWRDIKGGNIHALKRGLTYSPDHDLKALETGLLGALSLHPVVPAAQGIVAGAGERHPWVRGIGTMGGNLLGNIAGSLAADLLHLGPNTVSMGRGMLGALGRGLGSAAAYEALGSYGG